MKHCETCTCSGPVPPEPPIGTVIVDKYGGKARRFPNGNWGESGLIPLALWIPMWESRGPLTIIGTYPEVRA